MTWKEIKAKREERVKTFNQASELRTKAVTEKRDLTAEEKQQYDKMLDDVEKVGTEIERMERELDLSNQVRNDRGNIGREETRTLTDEDRQLRKAAFEKALRRGHDALNVEERALLTTSGNGVMVPEENTGRFFEVQKSFGGFRAAGATIIPTATGGDVPIPVLDDTANVAEEIADGSEVDSADATVTEKVLGAKIFDSKWIKVSEFLLNDASFPVEAFIDKAADVRIQRKSNLHYTTNLISAAATGHTQTAASESYITYADLVALFTSVDPLYRNNATWMFNDTTLRMLMEMVDDQGRPLWVPGVANGAPNLILGKPYTVNPDMPDIADAAKPLAFGDFSYYMIRDVQQVIMKRDSSLFAGNLQVGFLKAIRTDGALAVAGAVKVLVAA